MSKVGLVLGGGGITGASFELATLLALQLATGWDPNDAEVIVGTSAGATVAATVRADALSLDSLVAGQDGREQLAAYLRDTLFVRTRDSNGFRPSARNRLGRWVRHGLVPGARRPGLALMLGSPAPYSASGVGDWVEQRIGPSANGWPERTTLIVAAELESRSRVVFGADGAPSIPLRDAVAASSAVPVIYEPLAYQGRHYIDGGVLSGTHADVLLGRQVPLDLVLIVAPMAALQPRNDARFFEDVFDRVGRAALTEELERLDREWPDTDVLVFRPTGFVLEAMRPNPMDPEAAVPTFIKTLRWLRREMVKPDVWDPLEHHLVRERTANP